MINNIWEFAILNLNNNLAVLNINSTIQYFEYMNKRYVIKLYEEKAYNNYINEVLIYRFKGFHSKPTFIYANKINNKYALIYSFINHASITIDLFISAKIINSIAVLHNSKLVIKRTYLEQIQNVIVLYAKMNNKNPKLLQNIEYMYDYFANYSDNGNIHGDLFLKNILFNNENSLSVFFIDFEWSTYGPKSWDFYKLLSDIGEINHSFRKKVEHYIFDNEFLKISNIEFKNECKMFNNYRMVLEELHKKALI